MDGLTEKLLDMAIENILKNLIINDDILRARDDLKLLFLDKPNIEHIKEVLGDGKGVSS
jgi:hypothetical protein